jgi:hypothetical protein
VASYFGVQYIFIWLAFSSHTPISTNFLKRKFILIGVYFNSSINFNFFNDLNLLGGIPFRQCILPHPSLLLRPSLRVEHQRCAARQYWSRHCEREELRSNLLTCGNLQQPLDLKHHSNFRSLRSPPKTAPNSTPNYFNITRFCTSLANFAVIKNLSGCSRKTLEYQV